MSYGNPYAQQGGYGQNPYDQRDDDGYNQGGYNQGGGYGQGGGYNRQPAMEMQSMNGGSDPNAILNECQAIDRAIDDLDQRLEQLKMSQRQFINRGDDSATGPLMAEGREIMDSYRSLVDRVRKIKGKRDASNGRNSPQVGRVDRRLKQAITAYQQTESQFRKQAQEQAARQYRIVRPDASEDEVQAAVENPEGGIFQQALMQSGRSQNAQRTLGAVRARHEAIQQIERQMIELAQLFQDLDTIVMEQEPLVANIEAKGEEIHDNVVKANEEISTAIVSARGARRKKWWCLLICLLIIIVIVVVVAVVVVINRGGK